ncbi:MAG: hypothetical protein KHW59_04305, partial [Clostridiales bacterium]|nr:hypothetical protein [Clostridiales bacterium]
NSKAPLCKGGKSALADWGIVFFNNPSDTAVPCHLPLHRGGLGVVMIIPIHVKGRNHPLILQSTWDYATII